MRVFIVIFISSFIPFSIFSQLDSAQAKTEKEWEPSYQIEAEFEANYGSTDLNNEFIDKLLFGGEITPDLKDKVLKRTNKRNRFGLELNYEVKFTELRDTPQNHFVFNCSV